MNYYNNIKSIFSSLVESQKKSTEYNEALVHTFFEKNPLCLLGTVMNSKVDSYNHFGDSIFSKVSIGSWEKRVPDFIILTYNSIEITFNFIEIEAPNRKIFNGQNDFTADFNHAFTQLEDWKRLFPSNSSEMTRKMIASCFSDLGIYDGSRSIKGKYILVYGSSNEYKENEMRKARIFQKFTDSDFHFTSYDRLVKNFFYERGLFTLKYNSSSGGFKAVGWSPFLKYPIGRRRSFGRIEKKGTVIQSSKDLTKKEKDDLVQAVKDKDSENISVLEDKDMGLEFFNDFNAYD